MRAALVWSAALLVVLGAVVAGVLVASATVFSASSFARDYLTSLAAGRVDEVLGLPGVEAGDLDERLLDADALGAFTFEITGDEEVDGVHRIRVAFAGDDADGETTLLVERTGTVGLVFPSWGFARSPITEIEVVVTGHDQLVVGAQPVRVVDGGPVAFAALTPGVYRVSHDSEYLTAEPVTVLAEGDDVTVAIALEPDEAFVDAVQTAMEAELSVCTTQPVLFPTGCAFGFAVENRVVSDPVWTILEMPEATIAASDEFGRWAVPAAPGVAHLSVEVQSLFDGSVSTLEKDVPFDANYLIAFDGDAIVLVEGY